MFNRKKINLKTIIIFAIVVFLAIVAVVSVLYINSNQRNGYLKISNLGDYTKGKPTNPNTVRYIEEQLYKTVNMNLEKPVKSNSVKDVLIRYDTFRQDFNDQEQYYTVDFIVDISSLKQSYEIKYSWSSNNSSANNNIDERGTAVLCLPKNMLYYGDFKCKDGFTEEEQAQDPIFRYLPYSTLDYTVTYGSNAERKILVIEIKTSAADEKTDPMAAINTYQEEAKAWLNSLEGINPSDYVIQWKYSRASLY